MAAVEVDSTAVAVDSTAVEVDSTAVAVATAVVGTGNSGVIKTKRLQGSIPAAAFPFYTAREFGG
jgi:hypothetical protein